MKYDIDYFINKFNNIPEDQWTRFWYTDKNDKSKHCALGHCGEKDYGKPTDESLALRQIFHDVAFFNDVSDNPKQHVITRLIQLKAEQK